MAGVDELGDPFGHGSEDRLGIPLLRIGFDGDDGGGFPEQAGLRGFLVRRVDARGQGRVLPWKSSASLGEDERSRPEAAELAPGPLGRFALDLAVRQAENRSTVR